MLARLKDLWLQWGKLKASQGKTSLTLKEIYLVKQLKQYLRRKVKLQ
jgi:hypothetical protein